MCLPFFAQSPRIAVKASSMTPALLLSRDCSSVTCVSGFWYLCKMVCKAGVTGFLACAGSQGMTQAVTSARRQGGPTFCWNFRILHMLACCKVFPNLPHGVAPTMHACSLHRRAADRNAAWGIVLAIGISAVVGLMYVVALMFSIQVKRFSLSVLEPERM